ncbi:MAG: hypothetical protein EBY18_22290, partial [Alphaproteobacteria bacterium]|nr:hypothetical protein [Alphaproteobacteria bacterium]
MIRRRALVAAGVLTPWAASSQGAWAQSPWKGYYATGMKQRAAPDHSGLSGLGVLPMRWLIC